MHARRARLNLGRRRHRKPAALGQHRRHRMKIGRLLDPQQIALAFLADPLRIDEQNPALRRQIVGQVAGDWLPPTASAPSTVTSISSSVSWLRCVATSNERSDSISSSNSSMRTGRSQSVAKMSRCRRDARTRPAARPRSSHESRARPASGAARRSRSARPCRSTRVAAAIASLRGDGCRRAWIEVTRIGSVGGRQV